MGFVSLMPQACCAAYENQRRHHLHDFGEVLDDGVGPSHTGSVGHPGWANRSPRYATRWDELPVVRF